MAGPTAAADAVDEFQADLLSHDSATETLTRWCARRGLASPAVIRAERVQGDEKPAPEAVLAELHAGAGVAVRYRRVRLACGDHVLSQAENWYVPSHLTAEMNARLDASDTPFGAVVRPLGFHRRTLAARRTSAPGTILEVSAVLLTADESPFSYVVETYAADLVAVTPGR